jgi:hypothetical protein
MWSHYSCYLMIALHLRMQNWMINSFLLMMGWDYASNRPIFHPWNHMSGGMILTGKTKDVGEKPVPMPPCPPEVPYRLNWVQTGLRGERPATSHLSHGMAWPDKQLTNRWYKKGNFNIGVKNVFCMTLHYVNNLSTFLEMCFIFGGCSQPAFPLCYAVCVWEVFKKCQGSAPALQESLQLSWDRGRYVKK